MAKWIIGSIVVALVAGGLWYSGALAKFGMMPSPTPTSTPVVATTTQAVAQPENGMSANNDASNAALAQDTAAIDAQITGLSQDSAHVDSSMNDKSTQ